MPMNTRDLWLLLKAQDQTNRALNSFSRNVRNAGNQVRAAQLEAERAASLGAIAQAKLTQELNRSEIAHLNLRRAAEQAAVAQLVLGKASDSEIDSARRKVSATDDEIRARKQVIAAMGSQVAQEKVNLQNIKDSITQQGAYNKSIQDQEKNLSHMAGTFQSVGQTATAAGFAITAAGAVGAIAIGKSIQVAMEYDRQVRLTKTQIDDFGVSLDQIAAIGRRVAKEIAVPFEQIQPALFDIFSSIDVNVTDAEKLLTEFAKAAVAGQTDIQSVSRGTIGIMNAFGLGAQDLNRILDIQFKLVQKGIGNYDEWADRFGKVSPSAQRAGQSIETMAAALASATRFGVPAAQAATSVARVFDALSNPAAVAKLKEMGVAVTDAKGNFRDFGDIMNDFRAALQKMPGGEADKVAAILNVFKSAGGTIEARKFLNTLLLSSDGMKTFNEILDEVSHSAGSMEQAYGTMADSTASKTQLLKNNWALLQEGIGKALTPAVSDLITWLTKLLDMFNSLDPGTQKTVAYVLLAGTAFALVVGPVLLLIGAIAGIVAAFTVAGPAIAIVSGVLAGLVLGLAAAAALFTLLWKNSEPFRNIVKDMAGRVKELWDIAVNFAKDLKDAWDKNLGPPLEKLWDIIETKVLPAFREIQEKVSGELLQKIKEAGRILVDVAEKGFQFIGWVITTFVIPAIKAMSDWWQEHKKELEPLLSLLGQLVKWFLIIAGIVIGVLVVAFVGPFVAAIAAVIAVGALLVAAFVYIKEGLGWLWDKLKEFGSWIADVFTGAWDAVTGAISDAWNWIKDTFASAMQWLGNLWDSFWKSSIGGLVMAIFNNIAAFFSVIWETIKAVFRIAMAYVHDTVEPPFKKLWESIKKIWDDVSGYFGRIWDNIKDTFSRALDHVKLVLAAAWTWVKTTVSGAWENVKKVISEAWEAVKRTVSSGIDGVKNFFKGVGGWLLNAGKELIDGLINGIASKINAVTDKMKEIAKKIKDFLPGSPVKVGPLKVLNRGHSGSMITQMIADGMVSNLGAVENAASMLGSRIAGNYASDLGQMGGGGVTKIYNITQNITTQEINPVRTAAALGWEVQTAL